MYERPRHLIALLMLTLTTALPACSGSEDGTPEASDPIQQGDASSEGAPDASGDASGEGAPDASDASEIVAVEAIAVGENGTIWELRENGWLNVDPGTERCIDPAKCSVSQVMQTATELGLNSVAMLDGGRAIAVAGSGVILRRKPEGVWERIDDGSSPKLFAVSAAGGRVVGVGGTRIWELVNETWVAMSSPIDGLMVDGLEFRLLDIDLASVAFGMAVGGTHSEDGDQHHGVAVELHGDKWSVVRQGEDRTLVSVGAHSEFSAIGGYSILYPFGDPISLKYRVGDGAWQGAKGLPWRRHVSGIDVLDSSFAIAVTDGGSLAETTNGGMILHFDGQSWKQVATGKELVPPEGHGGIAFDSVCIVNRQRAFTVGNELLALYDGTKWQYEELTDKLPGMAPEIRSELTYLRDVACRQH